MVPIDNCNGMGRYRDGYWMPMRRDDRGLFYDPTGLLILEPTSFRRMTPLEIKAEMDRNGQRMCSLRDVA